MPENDDAATSQDDTTAKAQAADEDAVDAPDGDDGDSDDESTLDSKVQAKIAKANREARNLRQRIKELEPLARRLKDIEDKDKSESQRLADQLAELQTQVKEYEVREVRTAAAAAAGLPPEMAQFITASDADEAKEQAKLIAKWRKAEPADLRQGARKPAPETVTGDQLIRRMAGRQ